MHDTMLIHIYNKAKIDKSMIFVDKNCDLTFKKLFTDS